ncbi:MAG: DUF4198 domain-containing protein [Bryobacteraceae bacterium]
MPRTLACALLAVACLSAHDMWIEPTDFHPKPGDLIGTKLRVGVDFAGDPIPRNPALVNQFIVEDSSGRRPVIGRPGADPAGLIRVNASGLMVIGYRSNNSSVEQAPDKFAGYLKEEGLEAIAAARPRKDATAPVRELFSRCAKSLVLSGAPDAAQSDRTLGFTLELTAEKNPYLLRDGEELPVRLTHEGRPLAGALVIAMNQSAPAARVSARTDAEGRARLRISGRGMWMIKAVHLIPPPAGSDADWASLWASLTFQLGGM